MTEQEFKATPPDYRGEGVAVWKRTDKNGKLYLKIKVLGNITLNAFKYEPQKQKISEEV